MSEALGPESDRPRRLKRRLAVVAPGAVLLIAVAVSLGGHLGAAIAAWDRPLGYVDPQSLRPARTAMTVRRAQVDEFRPGGASDTGLDAATIDASLPDPASISRDLLDDLPLPERDVEVEVQMRDRAERRPEQALADVALDLPAFELDDAVLRELAGARPGDLAFTTASGFEGAAARAGGEAEGRVKALDYLADAGAGTGRLGGDAAQGDVLETAPGRGTAGGVSGGLLRPGAGSGSGGAGDAVDATLDEVTRELAPTVEAEAGPPAMPLDDDFDYTLWTYRPEPSFFNRDVGDGYFRIDLTPRRSLRKLATMPKDVVYLVDTSSSLPQEWVDAAIAGVEASLASLNRGDRFNVVLFNERPSMLSEAGPLPADPDALDFARRFLGQAESRGYTDVNAATRRLLVRDRDADRVYYLVLVSDGRPTRGVIDTRQLIDLITRDNDLTASIYCVGVGDRQDRELLDFLAYRNKGESLFVEDVDDAPATIADLMSRLRYPLIRGARFAVLGADDERLYPKALPNVHQGQRVSLFGRYAALRPMTMRIAGVGADGPVDLLFTLDPESARPADASIATQWAKWKLHDLYDRVLREGRSDELMREIRAIEREYDLRTLY